VSLPTGAVNGTVQERAPAAVVHKLDVEEISAYVDVPPLTAIPTEDADGETKALLRSVACDVVAGIVSTTLPCAATGGAELGTAR